MDDWLRLNGRLQELAASPDSDFRVATIANAKDVLKAAQTSGSPIPDLAPGYWGNSICITWQGKIASDLEVFEDNIEIYRLQVAPFEIWREPHAPDQGFSEQFLAELPHSKS